MLKNSKTLVSHLALAGLLASGFTAAATPAAVVPTLRYTLAMPAPQTHYFEVKMELGGFPADYTDIKIPVWAPGSYLVREFAKNVEGFQARTTGGQALAVEKLNKNTWRVRHPKQANFQVNYKVYAYELTVRTSFIDADHGYLNGTSVFMYPADNKSLSSTVVVEPAAGWNQVSTALKPSTGKFTYKAASYDELADSPFEIGTHKVLEFTANGTPHKVAMYGTYTVDEAKLMADMKKVCEEAHRVVGQNPLDRYLFIVHNLERGGGGLEHLNSTTLEVSRVAYSTEAGYKSFLDLAAHEYFHLWNVKRIRPVALGPFNYDQENYTNMLWVSEGMTSYYAKLINKRAGVISQEEYLGKLGNTITQVENTPGNKVQSAAESSFDAWIRAYRPNENTNNTEISYYSKGDLIGTILDLNIAEATKGEKHLDDVFRLLYDTYYKKANRGFTDKEFQDAVATVAGRRYDDFFRTSVYGTKTLDYAAALGYAGLALNVAPLNPNGTLGASFSNRNGRFLVTGVERDGAAWNGGLNVNDEVLLINGAAPNEESAKQLLGSPVGTELKLQVRRDGLTRDLALKALADADRKYTVQPVPSPTAAQQRVLARWLGPTK
ncbi:M61 family metallopeptidase [Hymenobacter sp. BT683]|uniref:M61 family metallopeptidase n=1 Tax=Hymenobacter jeongseonensis TaxID=2791027 RepID=A0ABS0ILB8_9BACT|nr:PDZ domain-containing protein [Hymenobacter jeongseonensis]MBF9238819.1 M61 family metallopeptidase [Hymenobacter jeongseonensis]